RIIVTETPTFLDYLANGTQINLIVGIDFTKSNREPWRSDSLHFRSPSGENDYTRAIRGVGNILQCYDSDKRFPVYSFGARYNGIVDHCHALNENPYNVRFILRKFFHIKFTHLYVFLHSIIYVFLYTQAKFAIYFVIIPIHYLSTYNS